MTRHPRTSRKQRFAIAIAIAATLMLRTHVNAAEGDLDPTFGVGGKVTTSLGSPSDQGNAVVIQADGKIVVAGDTYHAGGDPGAQFALVRYNADGSLDPSFGAGGIVLTDFGPGPDRALAAALQADGKIVAAGASNNTGLGTSDFALARYNADGSLDASFGTAGRVVTDLGHNGEDVAAAVRIQSDGKIVAAGYGATGSPQPNLLDFAVVRYNPDGTLDPTFDLDGRVLTDIASENDFIRAIAIQSDGTIVAAGFEGGFGGTDPTTVDFALARYNADGSLDPAFDGDGKTTTDFANAGDRVHAVALDGQGRIVVAGFATIGTDLDFALARYTPDGALDPTFDGDGRVTTAFGSSEEAHGVAIQANGAIVAAGFAITSAVTYIDFALARYTPNGALDTSFGTTGRVRTDFANFGDLAHAMAIQNDGRIVVAGGALINTTDGTDFAVARYEGPPAHTLRFYLHGLDIPETAGGFTMNQSPAPGPTLTLNLLNAPSWFSDPALTGTFQPGATFTLTLPSTIGLTVATTVRLSATEPDGSGAQLLGQTTQPVGGVFGSQTIVIPVSIPVTLNNRRLKLTISSAGFTLNLRLGTGAVLEATNYLGTP